MRVMKLMHVGSVAVLVIEKPSVMIDSCTFHLFFVPLYNSLKRVALSCILQMLVEVNLFKVI